jgi:DNA-binding YbaB/EbfC family protein
VQPGMPDMSMLLQQVQQMQEEMSAAEVTGQAGNGLVEITTTAPLQTSGLEIRSVRIDPKVVDPDDVDTLQDLIAGALEDAVAKATALQQQKMGPLAGGLGLPGLG